MSDDYNLILPAEHPLAIIINKDRDRIEQLEKENKLLRECVELILESKPVEDILSDKNKMFSWNMGLIVKAKETLAKIKGGA